MMMRLVLNRPMYPLSVLTHFTRVAAYAAVLLLPNSQRTHTLVQVCPFDAEDAGGTGNVPVRSLQGLENGFTLGGFASFLQIGARLGSGSQTDLERNRGRRQMILCREDSHALDGVFQFADIAGPGILFQHRKDVFGNGLRPEIVSHAELVQKITGQVTDIFGTLLQRRNSNRN